MEQDSKSYFQYWGKADPNYPGEPKWHPLVYHCLDVAAVAQTYLKMHRNLLVSLSTILKATPDDIIDVVTFLASFHDIGKLSVPFQKSISIQNPLAENRNEERSFICHVLPGWRIWNELPSLQHLRDTINLSYWFDTWCFASLAHHGRPPRQDGTSVMLRQYFPPDRCDELTQLVGDLAKIFLEEQVPVIGSEVKADYNHASWIIAGIMIVSDWIGSNPTWFQYSDLPTSTQPIDTLKMYWEKKALPNAKSALSECGLKPVGVSSKIGMRRLFPTIKKPTELQTLAQTVEIAAAPTLFIIEDATGTGKTEAAIVIAHHLMTAGRGDGIYFALPTMATSNRMYERIRKVYRKLYRGRKPSIVLAHSGGATALVLERYITTGQYNDEDSGTDCSTWMADSRKKALLAHVGVGTIDQALMGALRVKHQSMRLLGLSRKILVIDEIHACEPYVLEILQELLGYHAAQGGSAILLSATIPTGLRMKLVNAFAKGRGNGAVILKEGSFPLITQYDENVKPPVRIPLPKKAEMDKRPSYRRVKVIAIYSVDQAIQVIKRSISIGQCVCWVRNTVIDALDAYEECLEFNPLLFHARFTLNDRIRIGMEVETLFGIKTSPRRRRGKLVR
jgi:CRISPR-associated endonuclease/helicase Cas3